MPLNEFPQRVLRAVGRALAEQRHVQVEGDDLQADISPDLIWKRVKRFEGHSHQVNIAKVRPTMWAVTDGNYWRVNEPGGNTMRPEIADEFRSWADRIDRLNGLIT